MSRIGIRIVKRAGCLLALGAICAAPAPLEASFGVSGRVVTALPSGGLATALIAQPDGKLVAAGIGFTPMLDGEAFALARYAADGSLDPGFGSGGTVQTTFGVNQAGARALVLQPDGKLVAAGAFSGGAFGVVLARYASDGTLDSTFGSGGIVQTAFAVNPTSIAALILQPDGKLVAAGSRRAATSGPTPFDFLLVRYDTDGTLDGTFGSGGVVTTDFAGEDSTVNALVIEPDGKLVAVGGSGFFNRGTSAFELARYDVDGSLDATFGTGGLVKTVVGSGSRADAAVLQPDGKLVAAGFVTGAAEGFALARYDSDGSLDGGFGTGGSVVTATVPGEIHGLVLQPDGKLVAAGGVVTFALARYDADGTLDAGFGDGGTVETEFIDGGVATANALVRQSDGSLVAAGDASSGSGVGFGLVRYDAGGARDACASAPESGCRPTGHATELLLKKGSPNTEDHLLWKWHSGAPTVVSDFGSPSSVSGYQLCLYDASGARLGSGMPAGGLCDGAHSCWSAQAKGFKYRDRNFVPDGIFQVLLHADAGGEARIKVVGRGPQLALPAPPFAALPLTVQLKRPDGGQCWEATYAMPTRNEAGRFKAIN